MTRFCEIELEPMCRDSLCGAWSLDYDATLVHEENTHVIPDGCVEIVVPIADGAVGLESGSSRAWASATRPFVVGLTTRPLELVYRGRVQLLSVRLDLRAAARLLGRDLALVTQRAVLLDDLLPGLARTLGNAVEHGDETRSSRRLQSAIAQAVRRSALPDPRLDRALSAISSARGRACVSGIARHAALSTRQLDRRFDAFIGVSPKLLSRVVRFSAAWELSSRFPTAHFATIAAHCGYADQAHLSRDFREFSGNPPSLALPGVG